MSGDWLAARFRGGRALGWATTRAGGASEGPYASMNLGSHVGDDGGAVARNRASFADAVGARPAWLRQVHGTRVLRVGPTTADEEADTSVTTEPGVACAVLVADCLPVLFAAPDGRGVAAAHAGWRGLAAGVLEATVAALCDAAACAPRELDAWLGPCIGRDAFEVGSDVRHAFGADPAAFRPLPRDGKWLADLPRLATARLQRAGVGRIDGDGALCTVADPSRFFSFRRDGVTGRMAAAVRLPLAGDRV